MRKSISGPCAGELRFAERMRDRQPDGGDIAQGAAIGGAGGAVVGAVVPGVSVIEGAAVGAAIGGLAGAVWADQNNDGYVDGYVSNGQYYTGTPQGYDPDASPRCDRRSWWRGARRGCRRGHSGRQPP